MGTRVPGEQWLRGPVSLSGCFCLPWLSGREGCHGERGDQQPPALARWAVLSPRATWTHVCADLLPRSGGWVQAHLGRAFGLVRARVFGGHWPRGQRPRGPTAQEGSSCMRKEGKGPQTGPQICISETLRNVWSLVVT